jgi:hypothetical protein
MFMIIVKNSPGVSYKMDTRIARRQLLGTFSGSSLTRRKNKKRRRKKVERRKRQMNRLSSRSRTKIRLKIFALSSILPKLTFVTLTFVNKVEDRIAVEILKRFLENAKRRKPELQYLWVAEKQIRNKCFPNNIHFHLITNVRWEIKKWWKYWIDLQAKFGIVPREGQRAGGSAFDVKTIKSSNKKAIGNYIAGYLSKSNETFDCRVWHCSRKISRLFTGFYTGNEFIESVERLEKANLLGGKIERHNLKKDRRRRLVTEKMPPSNEEKLVVCQILLIPINQTTERLYEKIHQRNRKMWFSSE